MADLKASLENVRMSLPENDSEESSKYLIAMMQWGLFREDVAEELLIRGAGVDAQDIDGSTALHWAGLQGQVAVARWLLRKKAKVDSTDKVGKTPLHRAATEDNSGELVGLLIEHRAEVNAPDNYNNTPLHWGASRGQVTSERNAALTTT